MDKFPQAEASRGKGWGSSLVLGGTLPGQVRACQTQSSRVLGPSIPHGLYSLFLAPPHHHPAFVSRPLRS